MEYFYYVNSDNSHKECDFSKFTLSKFRLSEF